MASYNVEMQMLNSGGTYDTILPKSNLTNVNGVLSVSNGGTGVTNVNDITINFNKGNFDSEIKKVTLGKILVKLKIID